MSNYTKGSFEHRKFRKSWSKKVHFWMMLFSSYIRDKFLPLQPFDLFCILVRKIYLRSHNNFLICFAVLLAPWYLMIFSYQYNIVCSLHQKLLEPWQIAILLQLRLSLLSMSQRLWTCLWLLQWFLQGFWTCSLQWLWQMLLQRLWTKL